jgi:hypothetical protein
MHSTPSKKILMDGFVDVYYTFVSILTCFTFLKLTYIFSSHVTYDSPLKKVNLTRWSLLLETFTMILFVSRSIITFSFLSCRSKGWAVYENKYRSPIQRTRDTTRRPVALLEGGISWENEECTKIL